MSTPRPRSRQSKNASRRLNRLWVERLEDRQLLATLFVTNTSGDPGLAGSLPYEVVHSANDDVIDFSQLGAGKHTITLTQNLTISTSITIDGSTGVGFTANTALKTDNANLTIQISGAGNFGIIFTTSNITLQDVAVTHYGSVGVEVNGAQAASGAVIQGDFIGVDTDGSTGDGGTTGIKVDGGGATKTTIGGATLAARDLIGGNVGNGVWFTSGASGGLATGNFIGVAADGTSAVANSGNGVLVDAAATNISVGGLGASPGNTISANGGDGVRIVDSSDNIVAYNVIGLDTAGNTIGGAVQVNGVSVVSDGSGSSTGNDVASGNIISGNINDGVLLTGSHTTNTLVSTNVIGTDFTGLDARPNKTNGVEISGGASNNTVGQSNQISGNLGNGVLITGAGTNNNTVEGNLIGTDPMGAAAIPNQAGGVAIEAGASGNTIGGVTATPGQAPGNVISGNGVGGVGDGVLISGLSTENNLVQGNDIGTEISAADALPNANNGVELSSGAATNLITGNVISGNGTGTVGDGVLITGAGSNSNVVSSNEIGTDLNGQKAVANAANGVEVAEGVLDTQLVADDIAGNKADGVLITGADTNGTVVTRCAIGDNLTGDKAVPNELNGVEINNGSAASLIANCVISGNVGDGVLIIGSTANSVNGCAIGTNGSFSGPLPNQGNGVELGEGTLDSAIGGISATPGTVTGNLISGNGGNGVLITGAGTTDNKVEGNIIGADVNGNKAIANGINGIEIKAGANHNSIGGTITAAGNVISFNHNDGILISGVTNSTNSIEGNSIGTDPTDELAAGNLGNGVELVGTSGQLIGGTVQGAGNIISANGVLGASGSGVLITGATSTNNELAGNYIGTNRDGDSSLGNLNNGVTITAGATGNNVGDVVQASGNVISGNQNIGVAIQGTGTSNNDVFKNFIGVTPDGLSPLPNAIGVEISDLASDNTVGAADLDPGNIISGNQQYGVLITTGGSGNDVVSNEIGLDASGHLMPSATQAIGVGILSPPGSSTSRNELSLNTVSGNEQEGILIRDGVLNTISANTIGLDPAGNLIAGSKQGFGVLLESNVFGEARENEISDNTISGNGRAGVLITGESSRNVLVRNMIGVGFEGLAARPNGANGVAISGGAFENVIGGDAPGMGNVISANGANGVFISDSNTNTVAGNDIGTVAGGTGALPNAENGIRIAASFNTTIGGTTVGARNVISGNVANGVLVVAAKGTWISGNFIGTGAKGTGRLPNGASGVSIINGSSESTIGGSAAGAGNVISANHDNGVFISAANANLVAGNMIGTVAGATGGLGNEEQGIAIYGASGNRIGGTTAAERNIVSGNLRNGVLISGGASNLVAGNYLGTGVKGTGPIANGSNGVMIFAGSSNNTVGGMTASARNLIAGNAVDGVMFSDTRRNTVSGNWIGLGATGLALGNHQNGVEVDAGSNNNIIGGAIPVVGGTPMFGQAGGNVISSNGTQSRGDGVFIGASNGTALLGNAIGSDPTGSQRRGNMANGVELFVSSGTIIGGTVSIGGQPVTAGNMISSNGFNVANALPANATAAPMVGNGILINGSNGNSIALDFVGVGLAPVPGGSAYVGRMGNFNDGIAILNSTGNTVGSPSPGNGTTVISGNGNLQSAEALYTLPNPRRAASPSNVPQVHNQYLSNVWTLTANVFIGPGSSGNVIRNSEIGPNVFGNNVTAGSEFVNGAGNGLPPITPGNAPFNPTQDRPSVTEDGVLVINASHNMIGPNNLISGNSLTGIQIVATGTQSASGNTLAGNVVGLAKDGVTPLPNGFSTFTSTVNAYSTPVANDPRGTQFLINNARPGSLLTTYGAGIFIEGTGAANNIVGGTVAPLAGAPITVSSGNVISANWGSGVLVDGDPINENGRVSNSVQSGASANVIEGNLIGTTAVNVTGATSLLRGGVVANPSGNSQSGVFIQDSSNDQIVRNVVSENQGSGVYLLDNSGFPFGRGLTVNILVSGNSIGGDLFAATRGVGLGNRFWGVVLDSGAAVVRGSLRQNLVINNLNGPFLNTTQSSGFNRNYIPANYRRFRGDFPAASLVRPPRNPALGWAGAGHQIIPTRAVPQGPSQS